MAKKDAHIQVAATTRVNDAIKALDAVGSLAGENPGLSPDDVASVFGVLSEALFRNRARFGFSPADGAFTLEDTDDVDAENWKVTYARLLEKRFEANLKLRGVGKLIFSDEGADILAASVAQALHRSVVPDGVRPREWLRTVVNEFVVLDTRTVIKKQKRGGRAEGTSSAAIAGRLRKMDAYAPEVRHIGVTPAPKSMLSRLGFAPADAGEIVLLYRSAVPLR